MLRLAIRRSRALAWLLLSVHGIALWLVFTLDLPWWGNVLAILAIGSSAVHACALHAWQRMNASIIAIELADDCSIKIQRRSGEWSDAELQPSTFVSPWLTVLNLRNDGFRRLSHVIILPGRVDAEIFRRLRVWLRWRCAGMGLEEKTIV